MSKARSTKKLWELLTVASVFLVPAIVLLPVVHWRTDFTATLRAKSLQFRTAGATGQSSGIFNSTTPLDLTIERFGRIEWHDGANAITIVNDGGQASVTFDDVQLRSVDVSQPLDVSLDAEDNSIHMAIERLAADADDMATLLAGENAGFSCDGCRLEGEGGKTISSESISGTPAQTPRVWSIYGRADSRLHLTLRVRSGRIPAESRIALADGSTAVFAPQGQSAMLGSGDVQLTSVDRNFSLGGHSLLVNGLRGASLDRLEPAGDAFTVALVGSSDDIRRDESNEAATLTEFVTGNKPMAMYLSAVALIGSTLLTILTRLKLVRSKA